MGLSTKRVVAAAAVGGGGLTVLTGASIGLVMAEAKLARRAIGHTVGSPPRADGLFGGHLASVAAPKAAAPRTSLSANTTTSTSTSSSTTTATGIGTNPGTNTVTNTGTNAGTCERPLRFAMLGDSTAAGYGVESAEQTPGALLAAALAAHAGRPLLLASTARVGARSDRLAEQVDTLLADGPEHAPQVATIMIGANDVTARASAAEAAAQLGEAVARLRAVGCQVVVGTCPDLGTIRPIQVPLRWMARRWSRRLAAYQARAVREAGGRSVPIGALLGPEFNDRAELFGPDRFHPSAEGYAMAAAAVLPALAAAVWQISRSPEPAAAPADLDAFADAAVSAPDASAAQPPTLLTHQ